jgi:hypothetical protein
MADATTWSYTRAPAGQALSVGGATTWFHTRAPYGREVFVEGGTAWTGYPVARLVDLVIVWRYAKRGVTEQADFVTGTEDASKAPTFRDYEVTVIGKPDVALSEQVLRTDHVTTETYTYTGLQNMQDTAATFGNDPPALTRFLRFVVAVRDTQGYRSVTTTREIVVIIVPAM